MIIGREKTDGNILMKNEEYKILSEENSNKLKNIFRDLPSLIGHITDSYERYFESILGIIIISTI